MNFLLFAIIFGCFLTKVLPQSEPSCDSKIYCQGKLLDYVQMSRIFEDSKTFVDMSMKNSEEEILQDFDQLLQESDENPSEDQIRQFVDEHFEKSNELEDWTPPDYKDNPEFLSEIEDEEMRDYAQNLVKIWSTLTRKVKDEVKKSPETFSLIPVENGFVVPGGRFEEFYYWDTYWIIRGLLLAEMYDTVRGMLENFLSMVERYGFIPNGSRVYYLNRSQPPLLTLMVFHYIEATNDIDWLGTNLKTIEQELRFWLDNRTVSVERNGGSYRLAHYASESGTPRPESYYEDVHTASIIDSEDQRKQLYADLKSAAESGWDFSSRWMIDENGGNTGNLTNANTRRIIPVDLNAFLCQAFRILSDFYQLIYDSDEAESYLSISRTFEKGIQEVLYNEDDGIWYDFDTELSQHRRFFYPSNVAPLWSRAFDQSQQDELTKRTVQYLENQGVLDFEGGIPTSLERSGQQWDLPGAWAPLQHIVIYGLYESDDAHANEIAENLGKKWLQSNLKSYQKDGVMYEKYDAEKPGQPAGGGEYEVQTGFGWSNGENLVLIDTFYT